MNPIPGKPFRGPDAPKDSFRHLADHHGVSPEIASRRLHRLKKMARLDPADPVAIGRTGDVYNEATGEWIGTLTDPTLGTG
jgi:hypothetical protein